MTRLEIPDQYILPASRTDWAELLSVWQPLLPQQVSPWLLTKFGEIFFCEPDGKIGMLQVSGFSYQIVAKDKINFQEWLVDPDNMADWFLAPLVDRLDAMNRQLESGQCYSFIKPLALGGDLNLDNVMTIPIQEHFKCWGEVFRQMNDVPDGGHVVLKIY